MGDISLSIWFEYESVGYICGLCRHLQGLKRDLKGVCICFWQECQWEKKEYTRERNAVEGEERESILYMWQ